MGGGSNSALNSSESAQNSENFSTSGNFHSTVKLGNSSPENAEILNPYITEYYAEADKAPGVTSIALPATMQFVDAAVFQLFPNVTAITVAENNPYLKAENGMLLDAATNSLTLVPEGIEGNAVLPTDVAIVPACAFSRCTKLSAIVVENIGSTGSSAFATRDGILYTADMSTLLAAPAGIGASVAIAPECTQIAEGAFLGNSNLQTIVATGEVAAIAVADDANGASNASSANGANSAAAQTSENAQLEDRNLPAFSAEVVANATVATAATAAWEAAGFTHFAELAKPGDTVAPENDQSGFAFTLLPDYTMSVYWQGTDCPANLQIPDFGVLNGVEYTVSAIADQGFAGQSGIVSVELPASVASVGAGAFAGCQNLTAATLPNALTSIAERAFESTKLLSLVLPTCLQYVGAGAFANLNGTTIVALHAVPVVSPDALSGSTNVSVYTPYNAEGLYAWKTGLPTTGNHLLPYGIKFADNITALEVGDEVSLFDNGGYFEAPGNIQVVYTYKANSISIDTQTNMLTAKKSGDWSADIDMRLLIDEAFVEGVSQREVQLTPASFRNFPTGVSAASVVSAPSVPSAANATSTPSATSANKHTSEPSEVSTVQRSVNVHDAISGHIDEPVQISVAVPMRAVFDNSADRNQGYNINTTAEYLPASCYFENKSSEGTSVALVSIKCEDKDGAMTQILEPSGPSAAQSLDAISMFSLRKAQDGANVYSFGYGAANNTVNNIEGYVIESGQLDVEFRLDLQNTKLTDAFMQQIRSNKTEHDMAKVTYTFKKYDPATTIQENSGGT